MARLRQIAVLAVAFTVLASACSPAAVSPSPVGASAAPSVASAAPSVASAAPSGGAVGGGGNLVIVTPTEPSDLDLSALTTFGQRLIVGKNIGQSLTNQDPVTNELVPELALSWTNPEPTKWVFELRPGVKFHDGSPFDAAALVVSMGKMYDPTLPGSGVAVAVPGTWKAISENTAELTTEKPDLLVPLHLTYIPVTSAKQLTEDPEGAKTNPIGTGPYAFVEWNKGSNIKLKLFADSWLAKPGMYDTIDWEFRTDGTVRGQMIQTGEADIAYNLSTDSCASINCVSEPTAEIWNLRIDSFKQSFLGDVRVRKAIAMAIDRESMDASLLGSKVTDNYTVAGVSGYDPNIVGYKFDLAAAKDLLAQAKADGIDVTQPVTIKYVTDYYQEYVSLAPVIQKYLQDLGLTVSIKPTPIDTALPDIQWSDGRTLQKDMPPDRNDIWLREGGALWDFTDTRVDLTCEGAQSVYCNPEKDKAFAAAALLPVGEERDKAMQAVWRAYYDDVAMLPYTEHPIVFGFSTNIKQVPPIRNSDNLIPLWLMTK